MCASVHNYGRAIKATPFLKHISVSFTSKLVYTLTEASDKKRTSKPVSPIISVRNESSMISMCPFMLVSGCGSQGVNRYEAGTSMSISNKNNDYFQPLLSLPIFLPSPKRLSFFTCVCQLMLMRSPIATRNWKPMEAGKFGYDVV